jgi:hypothetical protein
MAATKYTQLIQAARLHIRAAKGDPNTTAYASDAFWSDAELLNIATRGTTDLWAAVIDLNEDHFLTVDTVNVSLPASSAALPNQLVGVPMDTFRVTMIEPADTTNTGTARNLVFVPRPYNHIDFINARTWSSNDPTAGCNIFYEVSGIGTPQVAPIVRTAPTVSAAVPLRFAYVPILGVQNYQLTTDNPIPGESDHALIAWIVAYARGKEREDRSPDPAWLAVYATEKQSLLTRMQPRQIQEPTVADGLFDSYWR